MRAAKADDIFVLLTPSAPLTATELAWQSAWQAIYGGIRTEPLHVSLQRFVCPDEALLTQVVRALQTATAQLSPVRIEGVDLRSFYSDFRAKQILKCRADRTESLQALDEVIRRTVRQHGLTPHYRKLMVLITVLEGIVTPVLLTPQPLPAAQPLFVGSRLVISRVTGQEQYELITTWELTD